MYTAPGRPLSDSPTVPLRTVGRRRHRHSVAAFIVAGILASGAVVLCFPDLLFGLDRQSPFTQLVSARPAMAAAVFGTGVLAGFVTVFWRPAWPVPAGLLAVSLAAGAMVLPRAVADPLPTTSGPQLTVLAFNTFKGNADVDEVAALIGAERPDLVALSEAGQSYRSRLAPRVEPLGYRFYTSTGRGRADVGGVTALVADHLGEVNFRVGGETSSFPYIEISGGGLGALRFAAFHSVAPVPGSVPGWAADLDLLRQWCAGPTPAVVAGDFNATLDHSVFRNAMAGCEDAAAQRGAGLVPTWGPSPRLRKVGPQIDHVIATEGIAAETFAVHDITGSDHRAIVTRLRLSPSS